MARLSGAAVLLLIVVVPLFMYTGALLAGIQLGRALERTPDSVNVSIRGVVEYFAKELWDIEGQRGRYLVGHDARLLQLARTVRAGRRRFGRSFTHTGTGYEGSTRQPDDTYTPKPTRPRGVMTIGSSSAVGGYGGRGFDMRGQNVSHLHSITLFHSTVIHSLACAYSIAGGGQVSAGPWGLPHSYGSKGVRATINLSAGEHLTAVEGTTEKGLWNLPSFVITSLTFRTSAGRVYGPYGGESGTRFSIPAADGSCIVGFWGRAGWLLDAIGIYRKPSCSCSSDRTDNNYPYVTTSGIKTV